MLRQSIKLAALTLGIGACPACFACDLCRDAVISQSNGGSATAGLDFNLSILLLLGVLFTVASFIARVIFKAVKSSRDL